MTSAAGRARLGRSALGWWILASGSWEIGPVWTGLAALHGSGLALAARPRSG